ncbi:glycosyltransferase family 4 protein [uncultured Spirosoma sp.]|uniref:glycosyltransferase family 4 protein n=1 Tax=uncultured Spirosoma sp. TaxID=278208 RepID=UPI0025831B90|nr:glycosyltransferase family 4 protein [uncultured Spirosoma sp.]
MKKILISAYACIPDRGSEEGNGWNYSSLISKQGYQVWCITRDIGKQEIEEKLAKYPNPNLTFVYVTVPKWIDNAYHKGLFGLYFHYIYWQWTASKTALALNKQHGFNLVHHVSYTSLQMGSFLYRLKKPFIFGPVGGGQEAPTTFRHYFKEFWLKEQLRSAVSNLMLRFNPGCYESVRRADYVLSWNEDTSRMIHKLGRKRAVDKVFGGIDKNFIPAAPMHRPSRDVLELIWVGRLMPRKGLELTLHGLSRVNPTCHVHFTIVGDGEMGKYVAEYIEKYKLQQRVTWVGKVPYTELRSYYANADVFYFTSLRDTGPGQLMEAMGYTLPVVTLMLHGQAELVDDSTGIRVPVTDPETVASELGKAIEWMYYNEEKRLAMGLNAYHFAQDQCWEKKINRLLHTYYDALLKLEPVN